MAVVSAWIKFQFHEVLSSSRVYEFFQACVNGAAIMQITSDKEGGTHIIVDDKDGTSPLKGPAINVVNANIGEHSNLKHIIKTVMSFFSPQVMA